MSYQEKRTVVSVVTGVCILGAYCIYAFSKVQSGIAATADLKFWASTILVFIGIGIVVSIVIQIIFHILLSVSIAVKQQVQNGKVDDQEIEKTIKLEMVEDEMDKLIGLKAMRIGFIIAGFGFIAGLVSLILNYSPAVMLNIMFIAFSIGSLFEGVAQLYLYKKGVRNA